MKNRASARKSLYLRSSGLLPERAQCQTWFRLQNSFSALDLVCSSFAPIRAACSSVGGGVAESGTLAGDRVCVGGGGRFFPAARRARAREYSAIVLGMARLKTHCPWRRHSIRPASARIFR